MRVSLSQSLRTDPAMKIDLATHKLEALLSSEELETNGLFFDKKTSSKRTGLSR